MHPRERILGAVSAAFLASIVSSARAEVVVLDAHITLLNVVSGSIDLPEPMAAARAVGPGTIIGVLPRGAERTNPRGFRVANPATAPVPPVVNAEALSITNLGWGEPYDVNGAGVFVGQARGSSSNLPRYAFGNSNQGTPLAPGLDNGTLWTESKATGVNNSNTVVGWKAPKSGSDQAFYRTSGGGLVDIAISGAKSSQALSINNSDKVAGYYQPQSGAGNERRGFVFDIASQGLTDFGPVVVPTFQSNQWFDQYRSISINDLGQVAATREVGTGADKISQAFLRERDGTTTPIAAVGAYEESFAAGLSNTGWVVGFLRDKQGRGADTGFLWAAGKTFDLSTLVLPDGWTGISVVHDGYSIVDSSDPLGLRQIGTIVGEGTYLGQSRAFAMQVTMQVPEPHTYLMLGIGLLAIGTLRLRRLTSR